METYTGKILVAHPELRGPMFQRSVIFVMEHSLDRGAQGLILNKTIGYPVEQIFSNNGLTIDSRDVVHKGGPLNERSISLFHTGEWVSSNTYPVGNYCVSSDKFMLEKMATGPAPVYWRMVSGVSGWAPGQLEAEIEGKGPMMEKSWLTLPPNDSILFEYDGEEQWKKAIEACSQQIVDAYF